MNQKVASKRNETTTLDKTSKKLIDVLLSEFIHTNVVVMLH